MKKKVQTFKLFILFNILSEASCSEANGAQTTESVEQISCRNDSVIEIIRLRLPSELQNCN